MAESTEVQDRIDEIRAKAGEVLAEKGLTVQDATLMLLTKIARDGAVPPDLLTPEDQYDAWFRAKVQEALDDPRPGIPGEEVEAYFAKRRAELRARIASGEKQ
jgi:DNA-damage-inducible protein J